MQQSERGGRQSRRIIIPKGTIDPDHVNVIEIYGNTSARLLIAKNTATSTGCGSSSVDGKSSCETILMAEPFNQDDYENFDTSPPSSQEHTNSFAVKSVEESTKSVKDDTDNASLVELYPVTNLALSEIGRSKMNASLFPGGRPPANSIKSTLNLGQPSSRAPLATKTSQTDGRQPNNEFRPSRVSTSFKDESNTDRVDTSSRVYQTESRHTTDEDIDETNADANTTLFDGSDNDYPQSLKQKSSIGGRKSESRKSGILMDYNDRDAPSRVYQMQSRQTIDEDLETNDEKATHLECSDNDCPHLLKQKQSIGGRKSESRKSGVSMDYNDRRTSSRVYQLMQSQHTIDDIKSNDDEKATLLECSDNNCPHHLLMPQRPSISERKYVSRRSGVSMKSNIDLVSTYNKTSTNSMVKDFVDKDNGILMECHPDCDAYWPEELMSDIPDEEEEELTVEQVIDGECSECYYQDGEQIEDESTLEPNEYMRSSFGKTASTRFGEERVSYLHFNYEPKNEVEEHPKAQPVENDVRSTKSSTSVNKKTQEQGKKNEQLGNRLSLQIYQELRCGCWKKGNTATQSESVMTDTYDVEEVIATTSRASESASNRRSTQHSMPESRAFVKSSASRNSTKSNKSNNQLEAISSLVEEAESAANQFQWQCKCLNLLQTKK